MGILAVRDRMVYPIAVIAALSAVTSANTVSPVPSPPLIKVSALRLQAEVTSLVTGVAGVAGAEQPAAAASTLTGTGTTADTLCTYPCTVFDKILSNLPEDIRYAILPTLYVAASVLGLLLAPVMLVTSALFGWPTSLWPAAAVTPEISPAPKTTPAPAEATAVASDPIRSHADPVVSSTVPEQPGIAGEAAVQPSSASDDHSGRPRRQRGTAAVTDPSENSVSPEAGTPWQSATTETVTPGEPAPAETAPADTSADVTTPEVDTVAEEDTRLEDVTDDTSEASAGRTPKADRATAPTEATQESPRRATRSTR